MFYKYHLIDFENIDTIANVDIICFSCNSENFCDSVYNNDVGFGLYTLYVLLLERETHELLKRLFSNERSNHINKGSINYAKI